MRNKQNKRRCLVACIMMVVAATSAFTFGQEYNHEFGPIVGISSYMGDANKTRPFLHPRPAVGAIHRYNINFHWAVKTTLKAGLLYGDTNDTGSVFADGNRFTFSRGFADIGSQIEFSFFPYSDKYAYLETMPFTPYLFAGVGCIFATGEDLFFDANIPVGIGFKYKPRNRMNVGVEFSIHKLFSDRLDVTEKQNAQPLDAPYGIKRNFLKNNDWFTLGMFYVTWEFGLKSDPCHGL